MLLKSIKLAAVACVTWFPTSRLEPSVDEQVLRIPNDACSSFTLIAGSLASARIVVLGDEHVRKDETLQCLNEITRNKIPQTIYFEGIERGLEYDCGSLDFRDARHERLLPRPNQSCRGWDNMSAARNVSLLRKDLGAIHSQLPRTIPEYCTQLQTVKYTNHIRMLSFLKAMGSTPKGRISVAIIGLAHVLSVENDSGDSFFLREALDDGSFDIPYAILGMLGTKALPLKKTPSFDHSELPHKTTMDPGLKRMCNF